jgi:hypothetical protein
MKTIRLDTKEQFQKFIRASAFKNQIENLYLGTDATDFLFSSPLNAVLSQSQLSFFSNINYFPVIQNIHLELKHLYMLKMLTDEPELNNNFMLIKGLIARPLRLSQKESNEMLEKKYGVILKEVTAADRQTYFFNINLTWETLLEIEKFTALQHLSISVAGGTLCDYEDIHYLLHALPQLKNLDLSIPYDLAYNPNQVSAQNEAAKKYCVTEKSLNYYPNITRLSLSGNYNWPTSLLTHFPNVSELTIDYKHYDTPQPDDACNTNKINQLLAQLPNPKQLLSLTIPASLPILSLPAQLFSKAIKFQAMKAKLITTDLEQLNQFNLKKLTLKQPKKFYCEIEKDSSPVIMSQLHYLLNNEKNWHDIEINIEGIDPAEYPNLSFLTFPNIKFSKNHSISYLNEAGEKRTEEIEATASTSLREKSNENFRRNFFQIRHPNSDDDKSKKNLKPINPAYRT